MRNHVQEAPVSFERSGNSFDSIEPCEDEFQDKDQYSSVSENSSAVVIVQLSSDISEKGSDEIVESYYADILKHNGNVNYWTPCYLSNSLLMAHVWQCCTLIC